MADITNSVSISEITYFNLLSKVNSKFRFNLIGFLLYCFGNLASVSMKTYLMKREQYTIQIVLKQLKQHTL